MSKFNYYYNNVPGKGLCRNNLIYTSLMNEEQTEFIQWYYNDTEYHKGQNQVVDPKLMDKKWERELIFLQFMEAEAPNLIPKILSIDTDERKIKLAVQGPDFWEQAKCSVNGFSQVCPNWQDQMLDIISKHAELGLYKFSLHPSSYFVENGLLKSINYFFCYSEEEPKIAVRDVLSHISEDRQKKLFPAMANMGISFEKKEEFFNLQMLCFESFREDYPKEFIEEAKAIYVRDSRI